MTSLTHQETGNRNVRSVRPPRSIGLILQSKWLLVLPSIIPLLLFFVLPLILMVTLSFQSTTVGQNGAEWSFVQYQRFLGEPLYQSAFLKTLYISVVTSLLAVLIGYPIALAMTYGKPFHSRILMVIVVLPLLVNVVVRAYGWRILLGRQGVVNTVLHSAGIIDQPLSLIYGDWAVIIGSLHVFAPLLILPLAASLQRIDRRLIEASTCLGASKFSTFTNIVVPLSLPGLSAGLALVFSSTASSFVMPALLGGDFTKMLGNLAEEQILSVFDWPFGATIAVFMMLTIALFLAALAPVNAWDQKWKPK